ncbi:ferredoxin [Nonomuraea sp. PA05]|uniref:ferredoxin n=1 Tax=Nonomuraea sp. PA05 TaxID=2604466 RepID=UPI0011D73283|nr:ferredoxin [Nonomuraea sp. PA05]TYB60552.1 ferredoxin [Nonomuraea sp. PA05]
MRVTVDPDKCCSSGLCALSVPEVFGQDEEECVVRVIVAEPPAGLHDKVRAAARRCPTGTIRLED